MYEVSEGWNNFNSIKDWWHSVINVNDEVCKELASFSCLHRGRFGVRNARVFRNYSSAPDTMFGKIKREALFLRVKREALLWEKAGAKRLGSLMPLEQFIVAPALWSSIICKNSS